MSESWYESAPADHRLTQGDIISACPLITWKNQPIAIEPGKELEPLRGALEAIQADVVVMTQACDLEQEKVDHVILCPHVALPTYKEVWEAEMRAKNQNPTAKAWAPLCDDICNGYLWNLAMLNEGKCAGMVLERRVVDFHEVYTLPRAFLESLVAQRKAPRLRLLPPYREHLSQAFARFFMRVGLPVGIQKSWFH